MPGPKPIFILSMPRSGSTLLQRILATHPEVTTVGEPHFLLPLLYGLRKDGVYSEYDHAFTVDAVHDFLANLPNGEAAYRQAVAHMAEELYSKAASNGERFFVDKAPRYALVAEDLLATFPEACFVLLWRNPLAVAASLMETYRGGAWNLYKADDHLYRGLPNLAQVASEQPHRLHTMHYEELVADPAGSIRTLADRLGLQPDGFDHEGAATSRIRGTVGDKMGQRKYDTISTSGINAWTRTYGNPIRRRWAEGYLDWIGDARLRVMGYESEVIRKTLHAEPPTSRRLISDIFLMPYGALHRRLDPPVWRARTQDSVWRYVKGVGDVTRAARHRLLGRPSKSRAGSARHPHPQPDEGPSSG